jgi:hypothetical protein
MMNIDELAAQPALYNDTQRFAAYSYLARLLAAEDIIVRWNVRSIDEPAEMDLAHRVLNVAPIKKDQEHQIPGLIFHEIGHFVFSPTLEKFEGEARVIDQEKLDRLARLAGSQTVWNIIEDGYIERRVTQKWPGSLRHLEVRYRSLVKDFKRTKNPIIDTINALNLNVLGSKWGEKFDYPKNLSKELQRKLNDARLINGSFEERAKLAGDISRELSIFDKEIPVDEDEIALNPNSTSFDEGATFEDDLEEFISENIAKILGSTAYYMQTIVETVDDGLERIIPNIGEIKTASTIKNLVGDELAKKISNTTFHRFASLMQKNAESKKLFSIFFKKIEKSKAIAESMYQRFLIRANAQSIAMTRYKTSGTLDMTRASMYMIYDDVFRKRQISPNKINHGYILMVDWSASMKESVMQLFHRIAELTHFAKLANVELDVWLYTTDESKLLSTAAVDDKFVSKFRNGVLIRGSSFIHVLNTFDDSPDKMMFNLFALYCNSMWYKDQSAVVKKGLNECETQFNIQFKEQALHSMAGTNIFEALMFAKELSGKLHTHRKAIMLMTDGDDAYHFDSMVVDGQIDRTLAIGNGTLENDALMFSKISMDGVDLMDFMQRAKGMTVGGDDKYDDNPFRNVRVSASYLAAQEARDNGVSVVGITWGTFTSKNLVTITRDNVTRVDVPSSEIKSKNPSLYTAVNNSFITKITQALLADIEGQTT